MKHNYKSFTLAEVLVVIGVIGVVAALTVPNVTQSTSNKEAVAAVQKSKMTLQEDYSRARQKYGTSLSGWLSGITEAPARATKVGKRFEEFLAVKNSCGIGTGTLCFANVTVGTELGSSSSIGNLNTNTDLYKLKLQDGADVGFYCPKNSNFCNIYIDIDGGQKGWNAVGKDIFGFLINTNSGSRLVTDYEAEDIKSNTLGDKCRYDNLLACTEFIFRENNMDYLVKDKNGNYIEIED